MLKQNDSTRWLLCDKCSIITKVQFDTERQERLTECRCCGGECRVFRSANNAYMEKARLLIQEVESDPIAW